MTANEVFINQKFQLRAGWRILINLVLTIVISIPFIIAFLQLPAGDGNLKKMLSELYAKVAITIGSLLAAYLSLRFIDKRRFDSIGLLINRQGFKELIYGVGIGLIMLSIAVIAPMVIGWESIDMAPESGSYFLLGFFLNAILFIIVGFNEEIMFRGYFFQVFTEGTNKWIPTLFISLLFAAAHLSNPNVSVFGFVNIFLAGILLGLAYYQTQSLWLPIGIHIGWNFTQGWIWGLPVSGTQIFMPLTISEETGPDFITGGTFGPEGGLMCTLVCILACFFVWKFFKPSETMGKIVAEAQSVEAFRPPTLPDPAV